MEVAERFQTPDQLFGLLDGRTVMAAGQLWKVEVFGIRDLSGQRWIQLGLRSNDTSRMATLRLGAGGSLEHATTALAEWITDPAAETDGVLNVA
jgi:hypothetical protein